MVKVYDEIIVGAGAAGLFAGAFAGDALILEKGAEPGKKLRACGGGRANFSNRRLAASHYLSRPEPLFPEYFIKKFAVADATRLMDRLGLPWEEREGGALFLTVPAARLMEGLRSRVRGEILVNRFVEDILPGDPIKVVAGGETFRCRKLLVAAGSPASRGLGGDGRCWRILRRLGHTVSPPKAALVPLLYPAENKFSALTGIGFPATVAWADSLGSISGVSGDALFTHRGLSGLAILTASLFAPDPCDLSVDFLPGRSTRELFDSAEAKTPRGVLRRLLPDRLVELLLPPELASRNIAELSRKNRDLLGESVARVRFPAMRHGSLSEAEVARGGVSVDEVNPKTLESRVVPGLYLAGEILDVAGSLGGYNLHWAFASAKACQTAINTR